VDRPEIAGDAIDFEEHLLAAVLAAGWTETWTGDRLRRKLH
jgi:hypothetical protein